MVDAPPHPGIIMHLLRITRIFMYVQLQQPGDKNQQPLGRSVTHGVFTFSSEWYITAKYECTTMPGTYMLF